MDSKGEAIKRALLSTLRLRLEERNRWPPPTADTVRISGKWQQTNVAKCENEA